MIDSNRLGNIQGAHVVGTGGEKIGTAGQVYVDTTDGHPAWVSVRTGLFGTSESFVPLEQADWDGDNLRVNYDKDMVKGAPNIDADGALSEAEEEELYQYYGLGYGAGVGMGTAGGTATGTSTATGGSDTAGTAGTSTDDAMTRSEEQLRVGTERVETGRARLRKYVVTDEETVTVPVTREEVRLEREPITDGNADEALSGPAISEAEHEVVLTEERPVVEKDTVPVERVRLDTDTITDEEQITEDVRKERIDFDADGTSGTRGTTR
ncbi:MAG: photosystem reaction center subunit [Cryobacterium sp.]|jgi:uncharacterized protein (TIGR02271 family)|nr:photosystem reaction center subunit [Cryobacterium sp.]